MSNPGPASPSYSRFVECRRRSEQYRRFARSASTAVPARSMRSSARTGPGNRHCWGSPAASSAPDAGTVVVGETERRRVSPAEESCARSRHRLSYRLADVLPLSVAENLYLAAPSRLRPTYGRMRQWAADLLAGFELEISPAAPTGTLSLAERQLLEVVKALLAQPKVLLLDEPTTALGPEDVDRLHALVPRTEPRRRRHRLRQPPAARGPRYRRSDDRSP